MENITVLNGMSKLVEVYALALKMGRVADDLDRKNGVEREYLVEKEVERDLFDFMMYLAVSDGGINEKELNYIAQVTGREYSREACRQRVKDCNIYSEDFEERVPPSLRSFSDSVKETDFDLYTFVQMFEYLGQYLLKADGEVRDRAKVDYSIYMGTIRKAAGCDIESLDPNELSEQLMNLGASFSSEEDAETARANMTAISDDRYRSLRRVLALLFSAARMVEERCILEKRKEYSGSLVQMLEDDLVSVLLFLAMRDGKLDEDELAFFNLLFGRSFSESDLLGMVESRELRDSGLPTDAFLLSIFLRLLLLRWGLMVVCRRRCFRS